MNINEVEKHVKSELTIQIIIYILTGLCFLVSLFAILTTPVKAKTQSTNVNSMVYPGFVNNYGCNSSSTGKYCSFSDSQYTAIKNLGTTYNGVLDVIEFEINFTFRSNTNYTFDIYANDNDFRNNDTVAYCYSYTTYPSNAVSIPCTFRFVSQKHLQVIYPYNNYQNHFIQINGSHLTGVSNYQVKNIYLSYDDGQSDMTGVIDNATQNTTDIINNNNSNTQSVIDSNASNTDNINQNVNYNFLNLLKQFGTICPNLFNTSYVAPNFNINSDGSYSYNTSASLSVIEVIPGESYTLKSDANRQWVYNFAIAPTIFDSAKGSTRVVATGNMISFVVPDGYNRFILRSFPSNNENNATQNVMMLKGRNLPASAFGTYCAYGSVRSNHLEDISNGVDGVVSGLNDVNDNIEQQVDLQQQQNDYLMDDTNPSVNQSDLNNVIGQVQIQDPLNYLLILPINLLTKLNTVISSGTCSKASFGELYGTELYLPCINFENYLGSTLWSTIDTIVGIGLLAIILKKFYDTISNILSLGKEEEIRKGMELPTPMEFFAQILGGGK